MFGIEWSICLHACQHEISEYPYNHHWCVWQIVYHMHDIYKHFRNQTPYILAPLYIIGKKSSKVKAEVWWKKKKNTAPYTLGMCNIVYPIACRWLLLLKIFYIKQYFRFPFFFNSSGKTTKATPAKQQFLKPCCNCKIVIPPGLKLIGYCS